MSGTSFQHAKDLIGEFFRRSTRKLGKPQAIRPCLAKRARITRRSARRNPTRKVSFIGPTKKLYGVRDMAPADKLKAQCTSGAFRFLAIHMDEPARQRTRELPNTPEFAHAQRQRKKVEALFAELKNQIGLRRLRLRRLKFVREQFFLAAAAQNIKRLVRFLSQAPPSILPATT